MRVLCSPPHVFTLFLLFCQLLNALADPGAVRVVAREPSCQVNVRVCTLKIAGPTLTAFLLQLHPSRWTRRTGRRRRRGRRLRPSPPTRAPVSTRSTASSSSGCWVSFGVSSTNYCFVVQVASRCSSSAWVCAPTSCPS